MKNILLTMLTLITFNANAVTWNETTNSDLNGDISVTSQTVIDSDHGLEWLMFEDFTLGHSIDSANTAYSGQGWSLATETQVVGLFNLFFPMYDDGSDGTLNNKQTNIAESETSKIIQSRNSWLLGFGNDANIAGDGTVTFNENNSTALYSAGLYSTDDGLGLAGIKFEVVNGDTVLSTLYGPGFTIAGDSGSYRSSYGVFMVRDYSVVPIPAAVWLFGSGLIGLVAVARRRAV